MSEGVSERPFLTGVIEGFYGRPWSLEQRVRLFRWLSDAGLNTYLYGPKDDLHHRASWRCCYDTTQIEALEASVRACQAAGLRFVYALGPGLDIRYSDPETVVTLRRRFAQLQSIGVSDFALLFDDIPDAMNESDGTRFGSFAVAQSHVANELYRECCRAQPDSVFLFCPTPYCSRMDDENLGGEDYLERLGESLDPAIHVFWTGPEIISREITEEHLTTLSQRLQRRPLIWDNYHANDYDLRRLYTGPIDGRPLNPQRLTSGIMFNPNCEFEANFNPIYTLGCYVSQGSDYDPETAFLAGLRVWIDAFQGVGDEWTEAELQLLATIYYQPFSEGRDARQMFADVQQLLHCGGTEREPLRRRFEEWRAIVHSISLKLTELKNRDLFYTFNRQWWEIREEFELLGRFLEQQERDGMTSRLPKSPEHLVGTYRGGMIRHLQSLLSMNRDGSFQRVEGQQ